MTTHAPVRPEMLRWALDRSGMPTGSERHAQFVRWASGEGRPTFRQLEGFARTTHVPLGYLFLPEPPVEELPIPDLRTIRDSGIRRPSPDLLDTVHLAQIRQDWYREHARDRRAPELDFVGSVAVGSDPRRAAAAIVDRLGYTWETRRGFASLEDAVRRTIDLIEATGVLVMVSGIVGSSTRRKLDPEEFRGFALTDSLAPVVFVNGVDAKAAQLFTLMHELAHIWSGVSALSDADPHGTGQAEAERWANAVAAEVLVPMSDLMPVVAEDLDAEAVRSLATRYRVSVLVLLHRLHEAGALTWERFRELYVLEEERGREPAGAAGARDGGDYYNTQLRHLGHVFARGVIVDALEGRTLYRDAFRLLGTRKHATFQEMAERLGVA